MMSANAEQSPFGRSQRMIVTEGSNDMHVIAALCAKHKIQKGAFTIFDGSSDYQAIKFFRTSIIGSVPPEIMGIVIDADNPSLEGKWTELKEFLRPIGYEVPDLPDPDGTVIEHDTMPKIGVWLMPDNQVDGMLENFCERMAAPEHIEYAKKCALDARDNGIGSFIDLHIPKAVIHTYLSWQDSPGKPLGQAITAKVLDHDVEIAHKFTAFLKRLFSV
ncbi:hypothetical protein NW939_09530 [Aeromonas caviae]|uniref:DUF3226 domain-containing protein n=1 Tax=Aeromonas caviae TaxID=648 RepID=UPI0021C8B255|nr:DUF3226 domain-containing protein [Aeromonas caviae]MCR9024851.1 hypothetical protein [Aeromonas caviae]